jgi:hypothetical protein
LRSTTNRRRIARETKRIQRSRDCSRNDALIYFALETYSVFNGGKVAELCRRLLHTDNILQDSGDRKQYDDIMQLRHIIVHNKCYVDEQFVKKTGWDVKVGSHLKLQRDKVREWIHFIDTVATGVDAALKMAVQGP